MIRVEDNFISEELILSLRSTILYDNKHSFGMSSIGLVNFYSVDFDPKEPMVELLLNKVNSRLESNYKIKRSYANIQYAGMDGTWHTDDGETTALLFVNEPLQGGNFEIKVSNSDYKTIEPKPGRLVIFDSSLLHRGLAGSTLGIPRISIALKLWK